MNRSALLVVLLGFMAVPLAHAEEPSVCASMCTSEKAQCTARAAKLTSLDRLPSVTETNPFARTSNETGPVYSASAAATERTAMQRRGKERVEACDASYRRCASACVPVAAPVSEQAAAAK